MLRVPWPVTGVFLKHLLSVGGSTCRKHLGGRRFGSNEVEMVVREWLRMQEPELYRV